MRHLSISTFLGVALLATGCKPHPPAPAAAPFTVAAAISLKEPLEELVRLYKEGHPGAPEIQLSLGASGDLSRQIASGAPLGLFASAAEGPAADLEKAGKATRACVLASNELVLVRRPAPELSQVTWTTLADDPAVKRVALGLVPSVPAGVYAEQALGKLGLLDKLGPKIVRGANVRHVLDLVARGEADVAVVYRTDVLARIDAGISDVLTIGPPPENAAPRVVYPLDVIAGTSDDARSFATFLCAPSSFGPFGANGFGPPG